MSDPDVCDPVLQSGPIFLPTDDNRISCDRKRSPEYLDIANGEVKRLKHENGSVSNKSSSDLQPTESGSRNEASLTNHHSEIVRSLKLAGPILGAPTSAAEATGQSPAAVHCIEDAAADRDASADMVEDSQQGKRTCSSTSTVDKANPSVLKTEGSTSARESNDRDNENRQFSGFATADVVCVDDVPVDLIHGCAQENSSSEICEPAGTVPDASVKSDVITLSDSEDEGDDDSAMNVVRKYELRVAGAPRSVVAELERLVVERVLARRLQDELRNEEAKLVLLKKMRHSQSQPKPSESSLKTENGAKLPAAAAVLHKEVGNAVVPPPLVRGGAVSAPARPANLNVQPMQASQLGTAYKPHGLSGPPPPLVHVPVQKSSSGTNLYAARNGASFPYSGVHSPAVQQSLPPPPMPPSVAALTPEQRQQAAKLALRKQLEKTLLQIPPARPPPPEMDLVPNLTSSEFIYLLGLEEIVKYLLSGDKKDARAAPAPFTCGQCKTDYSPVWKRDRMGSKGIVCESCLTTSQKRSLKQEHTNRLKSAFMKALHQERELEQRMRMPSTAASSTTTKAPAVVSLPAPAVAAARPSFATASSSAASEQLRQQQRLLQARHAAHLQAAAAAAVNAQVAMGLSSFRQMYSGGGSNGKTPAAAADLQRQYLLDMINPPRSWKT